MGKTIRSTRRGNWDMAEFDENGSASRDGRYASYDGEKATMRDDVRKHRRETRKTLQEFKRGLLDPDDTVLADSPRHMF